MKHICWMITLVLVFSFLLMPLLAVENKQADFSTSSQGTSSNDTAEKTYSPLQKVTVYESATEQTLSLSVEEYLLGVVAAEMSVDYHTEAIKAQVVAAYTYLYRKHLQNKTAEVKYDITSSPELDQGYCDDKQRAEKWGDQTQANTKKIEKIIAEVKHQLLVYQNEPILAAYHAVSAGNTESAKNVWGTDYPYLQNEVSVGDLLAPDYLSEVKVSADSFVKTMTALGATPKGAAAKYIGKSEKSVAGTVLKITICGKEFSGAKVRKAFSLRSAAFDLSFGEDVFVFSVTGYGHGVGMSQFGADYMARQGSNYHEILAAYYRGTEIVSLS